MRPVAVNLQSFNLGGPTVTPGMLSAFAPMARIDLVAAPRRRDEVIAAIQIEPLENGTGGRGQILRPAERAVRTRNKETEEAAGKP
jgi:hypothetical protein